MRPGRRAFFLPRLLDSSAWGQFCHRLSRSTGGRIEDETPAPGDPGRARLAVRREEDVYHARALCEEFGVLLRMPGAGELPPLRHWLTLDMTEFAAVESFDAERGLLVVQAGCSAGTIRERLGTLPWRWEEGDDEEGVDAWLARAGDWLPGHCADSGVVSADVMLASGNFERLGPFGADATRPLGSGVSGRLVASLFQLAGGTDAVKMMSEPAWPARYRLDGLMPAAPGVPNPAHVLLGAGGTLAWVARLKLQARAPGEPLPTTTPLRVLPRESLRETPEDRQDALVKSYFDPAGVFPS